MVNKLSPNLFRRKSVPDPVTGCWNWSGAPGPGGYGMLRSILTPPTTSPGPSYIDKVDPGRERRGEAGWLAHRASYVCHHGPIPRGARVWQVCHNVLCVNPDHLLLDGPEGTVPSGLSRQRKLTEADVVRILTSDERADVLAAALGVGRPQIDGIRTGRRKQKVRPDLPRRAVGARWPSVMVVRRSKHPGSATQDPAP